VEKIVKPLFRGVLFTTVVSCSLVFQLSGISAETVEVHQANAVAFRETSLQSDEIKQEPVLFIPNHKDSTALSATEVKASLQSFLTALPRYLGVQSDKESDEYDALSQTLSTFLQSEQFEKVVKRALIKKEPIQMAFLMPKKTKEAGMINDMSSAFNFPLQFESTDEIIPFAVTLSLAHPSYGLAITVETSEDEILYVLNPTNGSVFKRYGPALA